MVFNSHKDYGAACWLPASAQAPRLHGSRVREAPLVWRSTSVQAPLPTEAVLEDSGNGEGHDLSLSLSLSAVQKAKFTFLRCAILLKWEFRKELFNKLVWGRGLGAENDIFICMVRCWQGGGVGRVQPGSCRNGLARPQRLLRGTQRVVG